MTTDRALIAEPVLVVRPRPRFWTWRFGGLFTSVTSIAVVGLIWLYSAENLLLPFERSITLKGKTASKGDLFLDAKVQEILLRHRIRVHITQTGSREIAKNDFSSYDFVFPSGRPAANRIKAQLATSPKTSRPFTSPLVLATYREYAEALSKVGAAAKQEPAPAKPLYYTLDMDKFVGLIEERNTWNGISIGDVKNDRGESIRNGNRILAHSPSMCLSNSGETYLALVSFVKNGVTPPIAEGADILAEKIRPLFTAQGMHEAELFRSYVTPEGKGKAPIIVVYEHQYLEYQLQHQARTGHPDSDRVLLYPGYEMQTDPEFIALNPDAERLAALLVEDAELRQRIMELGYRILDRTGATGSEQLWQLLAEHQIPAPSQGNVYTKAELPLLPDLERMVTTVGGCVQ